ncbi:MAG TPA: APC family permease [Acidobacteriaceae bacterium]|jgi:amino acid transporter|nr:APC family permease [Acidobacteriaceae bacterium]
MRILDLLFGKPLASSEERAEQIGSSAGVAIFGLDALSSAAYGPEAALVLLIPLGVGGIHLILPMMIAIIILLTLVYLSYRQTIGAYPRGGGSFFVATDNLGTSAGLLAASALMIDYVLTVAVSISAGVGALVSAVPSLQQHTLALCLAILLLLTLINMRGVRDSGIAFLIPTYLFVGTLLVVIVVGLTKAVISGGHPHAVAAAPVLPVATEAVTIWLLLKSFASGCTAMTGIEAVSDGVMAFRDPRVKNARLTLTTIVTLLAVLLIGIAVLCRLYHVGAMMPDSPVYQSVLSQLTAAVMGRGWFYYLTMIAVLAALSLAANPAFADFPRLAKNIASHNFLPHVFLLRGRRLLHSHGIYALVFLSTIILILFGGITDRLIPLYAVGVFLAFTLSQAGMVIHWRRHRSPGWIRHSIVNGIGAVATGITLLVVLVAKFDEGAWVTAILIPLLILVMVIVRRHYDRVAVETANYEPLRVENLRPPLIVIPLDRWSRITEKALRFALCMSPDIIAVHVETEDRDGTEGKSICEDWENRIAAPLRAAGMKVPQLVNLHSPYRFVLSPVMDFVLEKEKKLENRQIAVLVPELVVRHWWENLLHNQRANLLKLMLLLRGNQRILVINIPWYLQRG